MSRQDQSVWSPAHLPITTYTNTRMHMRALYRVWNCNAFRRVHTRSSCLNSCSKCALVLHLVFLMWVHAALLMRFMSSWLSELFATETRHVHDNSAGSEKVAGVREPSVQAHFIFRFENNQGSQTYFLPMTKMQLKRVQHKLSQRTVDAPSTGRFREASSSPEKLKFGSARLSRKKGKLRG